MQVVLSIGKSPKCCQANRETLQRVELLVADSFQKGFHVVFLAITYFTIGGSFETNHNFRLLCVL